VKVCDCALTFPLISTHAATNSAAIIRLLKSLNENIEVKNFSFAGFTKEGWVDAGISSIFIKCNCFLMN